jgi:type II secretory pathway pseudopilin PulG
MSRNSGFTLIELAIVAILAAIAIPSLLKSRIAANETSAAGTLKGIVTSEAMWRQNDSDRNTINDYWTGDVSGFYRVLDGQGNAVKIMDIGVAKADNAPRAADADGVAPDIGPAVAAGAPSPKSGYYFQAMSTDENGVAYQVDGADADANAWENTSDYAFQANPDKYNSSGISIFVVNGNGVIWKKDIGNTNAVLIWPGDDPSSAGWSKAE